MKFIKNLMTSVLIFLTGISCSGGGTGESGGGAQSQSQFTLTITKSGTGSGKVTSTPAGIDCGGICEATFASGAAVTLIAVPEANSMFAGWSGDPDCADGEVTMDTDKTCTAVFNYSTANLQMVSDATYETQGDITVIRIPNSDCTTVTSTPVVAGNYLTLSVHDQSHGCQPRSKYSNSLLGYSITDGKVYILSEGASGEATLLYQPDENLVYWNTTFGSTARILDAQTFQTNATVNQNVSSDASGTYLDGLFYLSTINSPEPQCQDPLDANCGAIFAVDIKGEVKHRIDVNDGFRTWVGAGITTDGTNIYAGGAAQHKGDSESEYLYGCSTVKLSKELKVLASADPGDKGCYDLGIGNDDEDAVAGEVVLGPQDSVWVKYVRPVDNREMTPTIRYNRNLEEQCRVELYTGKLRYPGSYYNTLTVDKDGNAYVPYNLPAGKENEAALLKVAPDCQYSKLAEIAGAAVHSSPTLADDRYVLFATNGRLSIYTTNGSLYKEYALGSSAEVYTGPVIHNGVIYVFSKDATLTVIRNSGIQGYGSAYWPRYRRDNYGSGSLK